MKQLSQTQSTEQDKEHYGYSFKDKDLKKQKKKKEMKFFNWFSKCPHYQKSEVRGRN